MVKMLEKYGFGPEGSASKFPASLPGQLPLKDGPLRIFLVPYVAYGQGFRVTSIELVQANGAIANGGNLLMPLSATASEADRRVICRVLSPENAEKVKRILREVELTGTTMKGGHSDLYTTATSYASDLSELDWMDGKRKANMAGFIGFAPANNPRVEVYVGIVNPRTDDAGAHGSVHAAPVFKKIAEAVLHR